MLALLLAALLVQARSPASLKISGKRTTLQLIVSGALRPARWVRQVVSIAIESAPQAAGR